MQHCQCTQNLGCSDPKLTYIVAAASLKCGHIRLECPIISGVSRLVSRGVFQALICLTFCQVRVVDLLQRPGLSGRVEVKWDGLWNTLSVQDSTHVTGQLASVACRSAGYA